MVVMAEKESQLYQWNTDAKDAAIKSWLITSDHDPETWLELIQMMGCQPGTTFGVFDLSVIDGRNVWPTTISNTFSDNDHVRIEDDIWQCWLKYQIVIPVVMAGRCPHCGQVGDHAGMQYNAWTNTCGWL